MFSSDELTKSAKHCVCFDHLDGSFSRSRWSRVRRTDAVIKIMFIYKNEWKKDEVFDVKIKRNMVW